MPTRSGNRRSNSKGQNSQRTLGNQDVFRINAKNKNQQLMIDSIANNYVTIAKGAAGVGKSLIAISEAVWMVEKGLMSKVLYSKPIVDFAEQKSLGFLPGDLNEKTLPLLFPVLDNLETFCTPGKARYLLDKKVIEFQPLEFIRGRSLKETVIILDEAQNCSPHAVLSVISRIDKTSRVIILGDPKQVDFKLPVNGLNDAFFRLKNLDNVGLIEFSPKDILRNPFLSHIISRYD